MKDLFFLTWRHLVFNRGRVGLVVTLVTLAAVLPVSLKLLLDEFLTSIGTESRSSGAAYGAVSEPTLCSSVLDSLVTLTAVISIILIAFALVLAMRLRKVETDVLARIGASTARLRALLVFETMLIGSAGFVLAALVLALVDGVSSELVRLVLLQ